MVFIETSLFTKLVTSQMTDIEYAMLQVALAARPDIGNLIPGGGGIRKMRWAGASTGKRGGYRVFYFWRPRLEQIYLLYLFAKNTRSDLTRAQLRLLANEAKELK
jgi:hypothetical protein